MTDQNKSLSIWSKLAIGFVTVVLVRAIGLIPGLLVLAVGWAIYAAIMHFISPQAPAASASSPQPTEEKQS